MGRSAWLTAGTGRHRKDSGARHRISRWLGAGMLLGAGALAVPVLAATTPGAPDAFAAAEGPVPARSHPAAAATPTVPPRVPRPPRPTAPAQGAAHPAR